MEWRTVLGLCVLTACGSNAPVQPLDNPVVSRTLHEEIPLTINADIDVLFVIDSSAAMAPFATKLAGNQRELIQLLTPAFGPDVHVGVITADPAGAGTLRQTANVAGSFIASTLQFDMSVRTNVTGSIDDAFVALADVGSAGGSSVQPLAMAQAALAPGANPGFFRDNAYLNVVFITASDDSSPGAVDDYVAAFKGLKPDPNSVIVSVASGACTMGSLSAPAAPRLAAFAGEFPNRSTQVAICDDSLAGLVGIESRLFVPPLAYPCIDTPLAMPVACSVWLEHPSTSEQRIVEACPSGTVPCWSLVEDPAMCAFSPSLTIQLGPATFRPVDGTIEEIQCVIE